MYKIEFLIRQWKKCTTFGRTKEKYVRTDLSLDTSGTTKIALVRIITKLSRLIR